MNDHSIRIPVLLMSLLLMVVAACAKPRTVLVLIPEPDGTVGAVKISNEAGSQMLDTAGQAVQVEKVDEVPGTPAIMDDKKIQSMFGSALKVQPRLPEQFYIYFIIDSTTPTRASRVEFPHIVEVIKSHHPSKLNIVGHADRLGGEKFNYHLAMKRAEMVRDHLIAKGLDSSNIDIDSHGEANLLIPTPDEVAEPRNRRVEIFVH